MSCHTSISRHNSLVVVGRWARLHTTLHFLSVEVLSTSLFSRWHVEVYRQDRESHCTAATQLEDREPVNKCTSYKNRVFFMHKADIAGNREAYILEHFQSLLNLLFILLFDYLKKRLNKKNIYFHLSTFSLYLASLWRVASALHLLVARNRE